MKLGMVNKSTILNTFVLHTLHRNITRLAVITRKTNINLGVLKGGELEKSPILYSEIRILSFYSNTKLSAKHHACC